MITYQKPELIAIKEAASGACNSGSGNVNGVCKNGAYASGGNPSCNSGSVPI
jgi:hypothetical protein